MESCVGRGRKGTRGEGVFWEKYWKVACMIKLSLFSSGTKFRKPLLACGGIYIHYCIFPHTHPAPSPAKRKASEKFEQKVKKNFFCPHHQPHIRALQLHTKSQSTVGRWWSWKKKVFVPGFRTLIFFPALYIRERVERGGEEK